MRIFFSRLFLLILNSINYVLRAYLDLKHSFPLGAAILDVVLGATFGWLILGLFGLQTKGVGWLLLVIGVLWLIYNQRAAIMRFLRSRAVRDAMGWTKNALERAVTFIKAHSIQAFDWFMLQTVPVMVGVASLMLLVAAIIAYYISPGILIAHVIGMFAFIAIVAFVCNHDRSLMFIKKHWMWIGGGLTLIIAFAGEIYHPWWSVELRFLLFATGIGLLVFSSKKAREWAQTLRGALSLSVGAAIFAISYVTLKNYTLGSVGSIVFTVGLLGSIAVTCWLLFGAKKSQ
ncbi:MAG: hypothetical protein RI935_225 [Candidatus Parcubacteria bacterium]|jgi:hypothetical protein